MKKKKAGIILKENFFGGDDTNFNPTQVQFYTASPLGKNKVTRPHRLILLTVFVFFIYPLKRSEPPALSSQHYHPSEDLI